MGSTVPVKSISDCTVWHFSDSELEQLAIGPYDIVDQETKLRLLLRQLRDKLAKEEAITSPLMTEIHVNVGGMGGSKFGVYQDEETQLTREFVAELGA